MAVSITPTHNPEGRDGKTPLKKKSSDKNALSKAPRKLELIKNMT